MKTKEAWQDLPEVNKLGPIQRVFAPPKIEVTKFWVGLAGAIFFLVGTLGALYVMFFSPPKIPDKILGVYICSGGFGSFFLAFVILLPFQWRWMQGRLLLGENGFFLVSKTKNDDSLV